MPTILNLVAVPTTISGHLAGASALAAAAEGLYAIRMEQGAPILEILAQPMQGLAAVALVGDRLLVGGSPYGVATLLASHVEVPHVGADPERTQLGWQGGWMDHVQAPIIALAPSPGAHENGLMLAASAGEGILRSTNRGATWDVVNCGLVDFTILSLAWAPIAPAGRWPARAIVFAGSESGIYRSPAAGLAWQRCQGIEQPVQSIAVSPAFHDNGMVLAAIDASEDGGNGSSVWLSGDGGRSFESVDDAPPQVNVLLALDDHWLAATPERLMHSSDGRHWEAIEGTPGALSMLSVDQGILTGDGEGVTLVRWSDLPVPIPASH